jgi:hypothetical protein
MALLTLDGVSVLEARVTIPRLGAWVTDLALDAVDAPSGRVHIIGGGLALAGSVVRANVFHGRAEARIVGGAGGLGTMLPPKAYAGVPARVPLRDALRVGGESLAVDGPSRMLATWVRAARSVGEEVAMLAALDGASWRVLDDGRVWIGAEHWPETTSALEELAACDRVGLRTYRPGDFNLRPGTTIGGRRVSVVTYLFRAEDITVDVWFE